MQTWQTQNSFRGLKSYRDFRETGPWPEICSLEWLPSIPHQRDKQERNNLRLARKNYRTHGIESNNTTTASIETKL